MALSTTDNALPEDVSPAHILYGLMSAFALACVPVVLALVINLSQRARGAVLRSHLRWQRWSMLGFLGACLLAWSIPQVWLALTVLTLAVLWFANRIVKGWLRLADGLEMP
ncbi:hypothetical protein L2725_06235 [Shewanella corallii]|uniref:Transmembrane protein n=1 Tax=Shewanella corallii TaxID=560080 RepID=A0ABT0N5F8_9GAMM|nr:hypothetical protein [Shewanella corallii]MCL2913385.1 hypothetical protein [Shewanella corallii]